MISVSRRACLVMLALLAWALMSGDAQAQQGGFPKTFKLNYAWSYTSLSQVPNISQWPEAVLTLKANGSIDVVDQGTTYPNIGSWVKQGNQITFTFPSGGAVYSGIRQTNGTYNGTMSTTSGMYGVWKGKYY